MPRSLAAGTIALILGMLSMPAGAQDKPATEKQKIEALIKHVEGLSDAKFIRNGREYEAKTAARFLRAKWEARESKVKTAKDFITHIASKSSTTGRPYLIRLKNGKEVKSGTYLKERLKKIEEPPEKKQTP